MLQFLHAADLHLCSPLAAFSQREAAARRERQFLAFESLLQRAAEQGARLVLLAGDVFDTPSPDPDGVARFLGILKDQPLPVVIAPGNHDYWREGGVWQSYTMPDNVYVFDSAKLSCIDFPTLGTAIYGYAFVAESMPAPVLGHAEHLLPNRISILLAHADMLSPISAYAPISPGQLENSGFDYAALGHVHKPTPQKKYGKTLAAYSGFFAGRGFDEVGAGQALMVQIDGDRVTTKVLESGADRFEICELDCTGDRSGEEIRRRVKQHLSDCDYPKTTALRLVLVGHVGLSCHPDPVALVAPIFDGEYLEKDPTLRGAFYRALLPRLTDGDEETRALAAEALRLGFAALSGREV